MTPYNAGAAPREKALNTNDLRMVTPEPDPVVNSNENSTPHSRHRPIKSNIVKFLRSTQKYSAYGFFGFAGLHLTSTLLLPSLSLEWAESAFMATRSVYQTDIGEMTLVYGSMGLHIASGAILHGYRMWFRYCEYGDIPWRAYFTKTTISGWALAFLSGLHLAIMRWSPLMNLGDSWVISLDYVSYGLQTRPWLISASLFALTGAFFTHFVSGFKKYAGLNLTKLKESLIVGSGLALSVVSVSILRRKEPVTGWLADQFRLGYIYLDFFSN